MTKSILRMALTALALVLLSAGSFNLNRASAQDQEVIGGQCQDLCGCNGGATVCCKIENPGGPKVYCGMPNPD